MRGVGALRQVLRMAAALLLAAATLAGCKTIEGGPKRLYSVDEEVVQARRLLDVAAPNGIPGLADRYYQTSDELERIRLRNDIIARRMYIIDVEYSDYEASLTSERQKFGFLTTTAATSLAIASTIVTPLRSAEIVGAAGAAVLASRGAYDSEVVIAKTVQIAQGQMRRLRDDKAAVIQNKTGLPTATYPLSAALHDIEDYYRAGTLTAGLVRAVGDAGKAAEIAAISKDAAYSGTYGPDQTSDIIQNYIAPGGKANVARIRALNAVLFEMGYKLDVRTIVDSIEAAPIRSLLIPYAAQKGINMRS